MGNNARMKNRRLSPASALIVAVCIALAACAELGQSGSDERLPTRAKHFVYSPYKYIPVAFDADGAAISIEIDGPRTPLAVEGRSRLPAGLSAVTLAFATGECGEETWEGVATERLADVNVSVLAGAGVDYIVSTGGEAGQFSCGTDAGMERFIARYASPHLVGFDFDIERGQSDALVESLVRRIKGAKDRHPALRFSFTLATWAASDGSEASLNADGERVVRAIRDIGLTDFYVNLMVMDYGPAIPRNCVVAGAVCDMGESAIQAARNLRARHSVPFDRIELTPMIGVNDVMTNVFTPADALKLAGFVRDHGLAGVHFWSLDRDRPCEGRAAIVSSSCSGLADHPPLTFTRAFREGLGR